MYAIRSYYDTDALSGIEKGFYNVSDFNGSYWSSNLNRGFASADFDSYLSTEWTSQTGTWALSSGSLVQTDETEGNTNIFRITSYNVCYTKLLRTNFCQEFFSYTKTALFTIDYAIL